MDELGRRIRTLLRRCSGRADPVIERGELTFNVSTRQMIFRGQDLALSAREFAMFEASLERPGPGHTRSATSTSSATGAVQCSMPEGSRDLRP